ncbi:MAG: hypothetical protein HWE15_07350 [Algoriphagus sp.]|uniref:hypothetical protein n=1 Tax=Algoriphagus sp. TaxID=1872435 RepID=UPI0018172236|nr:hypothetical protein [Algoriphagus sp.]NVJ86105.1 hypothetical protein [Algoriphagus sp.]
MINQILKLSLFLVLCIGNVSFSLGQNLVGLWEFEHVRVGDQELTPIARWTEITEDGTYYSGNGWSRHSEGTWSFDASTNEFLPVDRYGPEDPSGPFKVVFESNDKMIWTRMEEGENVVVSIKRIEKKPTAHWDLVVGLWELSDVADKGGSETEQQNFYVNSFLYFGWDRRYRQMSTEEGRQTGYWHAHAHRPEVTLLSHNPNKPVESWKILFRGEDELELEGVSDSNKGVKIVFQRKKQFPG